MELLNANSEELESYLDKGTIFTNKKGMLWKYIEGTDPRLMTRVQLEARVRKLTPLVAEVARIRSENDNLTHILGIAQDQNVFLTSRTDDLFGKLIDKTEECATYKQRLIDRGIDPRCQQQQQSSSLSSADTSNRHMPESGQPRTRTT